MRKIDKIIIHCSDSDVPSHDNIYTIRHWHVVENGWKDTGYHFFIRKNGTVEIGRPVELTGSHVRGHNMGSIGICLSGRDEFTGSQMDSCIQLIRMLKVMLPDEVTVHGHCEFDKNKAYCPGFNYKKEIINNL